jgi:hypothetical protein
MLIFLATFQDAPMKCQIGIALDFGGGAWPMLIVAVLHHRSQSGSRFQWKTEITFCRSKEFSGAQISGVTIRGSPKRLMNAKKHHRRKLSGNLIFRQNRL